MQHLVDIHWVLCAALHASTSHYYCGPIARLFPSWVRAMHQEQLSYEGEVDADGRPHGCVPHRWPQLSPLLAGTPAFLTAICKSWTQQWISILVPRMPHNCLVMEAWEAKLFW